MLVIMSAIAHLRLVGINLAQESILLVTFAGLYFYTRQLISKPIFPLLLLFYLSLYLIYGLANNNDIYFVFRDYGQLLAMSGFFFMGLEYFGSHDEREFISFLKFSTAITLVMFFALFLFMWGLKNSDFAIYMQVQLDLIFLITLAIYRKNYVPLALIISFLSLKRMFMLAAMTTFSARIFSYPISMVAALILLGFVGQMEIMSKYELTFLSILDNVRYLPALEVEPVLDLLVYLDPNRGEEVSRIYERLNLFSFVFGEGLGGGVIKMFYQTGEEYKVSFAHFLPISILIKFGLLGVIIPLAFLMHATAVSSQSKCIVQLVTFGFVASIFAAYLTSSWAFWLCFGGAFGVSVQKRRSEFPRLLV